ncbi:MAG: caspase family protein, partial [Nitrospirota bacterium]|nr:caspase family protein [Nitrospirota bacterium]
WSRYDRLQNSKPTHGEQYHAIKIWDVSTGAMVKALTGHTRRVSSCAISADGRYLVSGSEDNTIKLWDLHAGREIKTYVNGPMDKGQITNVAFLSEGRQILSSAWVYGEDKAHYITRVWNVSDDTEFRRYSKSVDAVSQDGRYALSVAEGVGELCEALTGKKVKDLHGYKEFDCFSAAFSHDGRSIICGSGRNDGILKLWDVSTGQWRRTFSGHLNRVTAVSFSANDRLVISSSDDHTTRIWDTATGKEVAQYISFTDGEWIVITPEGYYNSSANGDKHLNVRIGNNVYGIENYREAFYRPDLVKLALSGGSLKDFKTLADVKQPPVVTIVDTPKSTDKNEAAITLKITDIGGGIGDIRLYLNGSAVVLDSARGVKIVPTNKNEVLKTYSLKLTNGLNTIRAIAFNAENTMQSNDVLHEITASFKSLTKPSLNAIIVGINEYKNPKLQLKYAVSDAELFEDTLKKVTAGLFEKVNIKKLVTKENTTSENIIKELKAYKSLNPDDVFVFFVASHGTVDDGEYFLITSNVGSTRTEKLK